MDTTWLNVLTGIFAFVFPPLGLVFLAESLIIGAVDAPAGASGAGCAAAGMIPKEIMIPLGLKVVARYSRLAVNAGGLFVGGRFDVIAREPIVTLNGPTNLTVEEGASADITRVYTASTTDMRPGLQYAWACDGEVLTPNASSTSVRFSTAGAAVGDVLTRRVSVAVTDADGLHATAETVARIHVVPADDGEGLPPVCRTKPWLPQCQLPLRRAADAARNRKSPP